MDHAEETEVTEEPSAVLRYLCVDFFWIFKEARTPPSRAGGGGVRMSVDPKLRLQAAVLDVGLAAGHARADAQPEEKGRPPAEEGDERQDQGAQHRRAHPGDHRRRAGLRRVDERQLLARE